jgi:O-succinylbenzoic acid--CoA ligase
MTEINCPLAEVANQYGPQSALISADRVVPYAEYDRLVSVVADSLIKSGVAAGDRIAIILSNSIEYAVLLMAAIRAGIVACPISTRLPDTAKLEQIRQTNARFLISPDMQPIPSQTASVKVLDPRELFFESCATGQTGNKVALDENATIVFTSGSSAQPKAALHTYGNHYYSALGSGDNIKFEPGDRWLLSLPLYHVGGLAILFRAILGGGAVVIAEPRVDLHQTVTSHRITHLSLVPTQLHRLLKAEAGPELLARQLKAVLLGGGAVPNPLLEEVLSYGWPLFTSYGLTEMASQVTTTRPDDMKPGGFSSGKLLKYRQVRISEENEILVQGETLFSGYVDGFRIRRPFDSEGWFATGDCGQFDPDGNLIVTGRKDNMFVSGGENIHPEEIEQVLLSLESVVDAVVIPVEDEEFGARPVAFVQVEQSHSLDEGQLAAELAQRLPRFKVPDHFYPWPEGKRTSALKPDRKRLKSLACRLVREN